MLINNNSDEAAGLQGNPAIVGDIGKIKEAYSSIIGSAKLDSADNFPATYVKSVWLYVSRAQSKAAPNKIRNYLRSQ